MATAPTIAPAASGKAWRRLCVLLVGLLLCRGVVLLCVMPPFEGWDEYQHVGYVVHAGETGRRAVLGETEVPRALLEAAVAFPQPASAVEQIAHAGAVGYADYWRRAEPPRWTGGSMPLYQAQHSALYYRLAAPWFRLWGGVSDLRSSVAALRALNLLLTAAALAVVLGAVGRHARNLQDAGWIGLVLAVQSLWLFNGARVSSDALGVFLGAVAVSWGLALDGRRLLLACAGLGLVTGLAILAKAVNFGLLPFVALCGLLVAARDRPPLRRLAIGALLLVAGIVAVTQDEWRFNLAHFGGLTPMQEAVVNRGRGRTSADLLATALTFDWGKVVRRLWLRDSIFAGGWSFLGTDLRAVKLYFFACAAGLAGWGWRLTPRGRRRPAVFDSWRFPACCLVVCSGFTAALAYHMIQSKLAWGRPTTTPWYACPALPWFLAVVVAGGLAWPIGRLRAAVPLLLTAACLTGEAVAVWTRMIPTYAGGASGFEALGRLASLQPRAFGTATLLAASAGVWILLAGALCVLRTLARPVPEPREGASGRPHLALVSEGRARRGRDAGHPGPGVQASGEPGSPR